MVNGMNNTLVQKKDYIYKELENGKDGNTLTDQFKCGGFMEKRKWKDEHKFKV